MIISVAVLIISNFYIAYIVILFSVIYFWYEIFNERDNINFKKVILKFLEFIGLISISGMISAFLILPTYLSLVRENTILASCPFFLHNMFLFNMYCL
ncbi:hypothetical protein EII29_01050 [Leptotrichia sp. OH3620_COT-345]|nr:hypothetical protein EII29_01050 [Leptotrichia sp. OH3620_COT-345]